MNRLGLVGAGAVGTVLARRLRESGVSVGAIASRRIESARAAVEFIGEGTPTDRNPDAASGADLLLLAVPDRAVTDVAGEIAASERVEPGALALHFSGALSSEALAPLRAAGATVGSIHPLQTFADPTAALGRLEETFLFYEGDDETRVRKVAVALGGRPRPIDPAGKVLYHAGAAAACNLAVAMVDLGVGLFEKSGIGREDALEALLPLLGGTVRNLGEVGLPAALTGPVARGDTDTVRKHVEAIREAAPELLPAFVAASLRAVEIGIRKGSLPDVESDEIRRILSG